MVTLYLKNYKILSSIIYVAMTVAPILSIKLFKLDIDLNFILKFPLIINFLQFLYIFYEDYCIKFYNCYNIIVELYLKIGVIW